MNLQNVDLSFFLKYLPGHVYLYDINGVYITCNINQARSLGCNNIESVKGRYFSEFYKQDEMEMLNKHNNLLIKTKKAQSFEEYLYLENGEKRILITNKIPIIENNTVKAVLGISINIDPQKSELNRQKTIFENIIDNLPVHIYWKDTQGKYLGCNLAQAKSVGYPDKDHLIGKTDKEISWAQQSRALYQSDQEVITAKKLKTFEEKATTADGMERTFLSKKMPWLNDNDEVEGIIGISLDITAEKQLQIAKQEVELLNKQLMTADLISASIAHEVRTPMATIQNYVEIIRDTQADMGPEAEVYLNKIVQETNRTNEFINILLSNIKKIDTSKFKTVNLRKCLFEAVARFPYSNEKDQELISVVEPIEDFEFYGDENLMVHVFFNLIKNAIYFIKATKKGEITIHYEVSEDKHLVYFTDTACGIKPEILVNIFNSFYTTSNVGSGIGLSFCKMAFEAFGGRISCVSEVGKYTKFIMEFPKRG